MELFKSECQNCINNITPVFQIYIMYNKDQKFCNSSCKSSNFLKYAIDDIKNGYYVEKQYEECPICVCNDYFLIELSCGHKICNSCIKRIFDTSTKCPICRTIILLKSENNSLSDLFRESITHEHCYLLDTTFKLINSIDYNFDLNMIETMYFYHTSRDISNDIEIILQYFNLFKNKI